MIACPLVHRAVTPVTVTLFDAELENRMPTHFSSGTRLVERCSQSPQTKLAKGRRLKQSTPSKTLEIEGEVRCCGSFQVPKNCVHPHQWSSHPCIGGDVPNKLCTRPILSVLCPLRMCTFCGSSCGHQHQLDAPSSSSRRCLHWFEFIPCVNRKSNENHQRYATLSSVLQHQLRTGPSKPTKWLQSHTGTVDPVGTNLDT